MKNSNQKQSNPVGEKLTNSFGVYVHIPYCVHRCSYCDFFSSAKYESNDFSRVAEAIAAELDSAAQFLSAAPGNPRRLTSIFFGGGTPSLMAPELIRDLLSRILSAFSPQEGIEITLEANPETVTEQLPLQWKDAGINRVSMGAQSFQPELLKALERLATPQSIERASGYLRKQGLDNFNLDLIFAIPGQDRAKMESDLSRAMSLGPKHLSFYNLTLKPGHPLYAFLPSDDEVAELYERGVELLEGKGYSRYEISNFAVPGHESRHNLLYWSGGDFLGLGPSASSRFFWNGRFHHKKQVADMAKYLGQPNVRAFEESSSEQTVLEATFLELRKREGVSLSWFAERYGYDLTRSDKFTLFESKGLIERHHDQLRISAKGMLLADSITRDLAL